jgi:gliding motility-associated-like protein
MKLLTLVFVILTLVGVAQSNDDCSNAQTICANQSLNSTNTGATTDVCAGCSDGASSLGNFCFSIENSIWFSFETNSLGGDANVYLSTIICDNTAGFSNSLDAVIIEAGSPCNESTYTAVSNCVSDESSSISLNATSLLPNTTYYVLVDGGMSSGATDPGSCGFNILASGPAVEVEIEAGDGVTIFKGENHMLNGSGPPNSVWTPTSTLSNSGSDTPVASPDFSTTYFYTTVSPNGCVYQDEVTISVIQDIFVTNTLTPNEDGINDFWIIGSIDQYPSAKVSVFDRWGQRIFHSIGYENEKRWDGTFSGAKLPSGTYFYIIDLNTSAEEDVFSGYVVILR